MIVEAAESRILPLSQAVPPRRNQRVIGSLFDLTRNEDSAPPVPAKTRGLLAIGVPDVERRAEDVAPGVVDEVAAEILVAEEDFDVPGERENARIGGDDAVAR